MSLALQVAEGVALGLAIYTLALVGALLLAGYALRRRRRKLPEPPK